MRPAEQPPRVSDDAAIDVSAQRLQEGIRQVDVTLRPVLRRPDLYSASPGALHLPLNVDCPSQEIDV